MFTLGDVSLALNQLTLDTTPQKQRLESFHLFSSLAPELRLKIWSFACTPRVLPIRYETTTTTHMTPTGRRQKTVTKFTSTASPPALLSVCAESRAQALNIYSLTFSTPTSPGKIYFSPLHDTLYFPRYREMGYDETARDFRGLLAEDRVDGRRNRKRGNHGASNNIWDQVRSIALDYVDVNIKRPWEGYNKASLIRSFPQLEEIYLIVCKPGETTSLVYHLEDIDASRKFRSEKDVVFANPSINPETLLRWWVGFRQSFVMEEKMIETAWLNTGRNYERFTLPTIKMVQRRM